MLSANNFGEAGTYINADYGGRWASNVVNVVEQYVRTAGYDTQVTVVGGGDFEVGKDLEPGWNGPQRTLDWADGYGRATSLPMRIKLRHVQSRRPIIDTCSAAACAGSCGSLSRGSGQWW